MGVAPEPAAIRGIVVRSSDSGGQLTLGELFSFTLFLGFLVWPIVQMANIGTQMTEALAGLAGPRAHDLVPTPG